MNKSEYQQFLNAAAMKDGEPVHPGLQFQCLHLSRCEEGCCSIEDTLERCSNCDSNGIGARTDPMALIVACDTVKIDLCGDGWSVAVTFEEADVVITEIGFAKFQSGLSRIELITLALRDAVFQATEAMEPDNWVECNTSMHLDEGQDKDCPFCHGTGMVMKETP